MSKCSIYLLSLALGFGIASTSIAAPHEGHGGGGHGEGHNKAAHGKAMHGGQHKGHNAKQGKKSKKGGTFSPHWAKTLTDEQKISFDKMHLLVGQFEAVQRAKMKMLKAELNVLAAKPANKSTIYAKIDEILAVKQGIMRNRFDHIAEMRAELTEQQRISYDMGLLKRGKHKH